MKKLLLFCFLVSGGLMAGDLIDIHALKKSFTVIFVAYQGNKLFRFGKAKFKQWRNIAVISNNLCNH